MIHAFYKHIVSQYAIYVNPFSCQTAGRCIQHLRYSLQSVSEPFPTSFHWLRLFPLSVLYSTSTVYRATSKHLMLTGHLTGYVQNRHLFTFINRLSNRCNSLAWFLSLLFLCRPLPADTHLSPLARGVRCVPNLQAIAGFCHSGLV